MEEERVVDDIKGKSTPASSPPSSGLPYTWGLFSFPIPEPGSLSQFSCSSSPPPQGSAVHALHTKVKALTQRRQRGRERDREKFNTEVPLAQSVGQTSSQVLLRQRGRGKGKVSPPTPPCRSGPVRDLSSSEEEEEEVEVQVRLEIHSPPAETQGEQGAMGKGAEGVERGGMRGQVSSMSGQSRGLGEGASLENLLSDNPSRSKDDPATAPQPPPSSSLATTSVFTTSSSTSSSSSRHWAPPKGFWRVARPETLPLNGAGSRNISSSLPLKDFTQTAAVAEPQRPKTTDPAGTRSDTGSVVVDENEALSEFKHSDSLECYLDRYEQREEEPAKPAEVLWKSESLESVSSHGGTVVIAERAEVKQRVRGRSKDRRRRTSREEEQQSGGETSHHHGDRTCRMDCKVPGGSVSCDDYSETPPPPPPPEADPYLRSLLLSDELPLSPRHEQAKLLLERARLKARSHHAKGPTRRSQSDQRYDTKRQQAGPTNTTPPPQAVVTVKPKGEPTAPTSSAPLLVPYDRPTSPSDPAGRSRRYGCSPTRVRFEDESEKDAESRYLNRLRERGKPGALRSKGVIENSGGSDRGQRSVSVPPPQKQEDMGFSGEPTVVIKEVLVVVKTCEACGSVVREPPLEPQQPGNLEEAQGKAAPRWVAPNKPEASTRPKAPLTVTFAGAFVLGQHKDRGTGWRTSGFGKLRRRSRKGESRVESGHGPYKRRNSIPRSRVNMCTAVSLSVVRDHPTPPLPIKSALKSRSKNRAAAGQPSVQFRVPSGQAGAEGGSQHLALIDSPETRGESLLALTQGPSMTTSLVPCIRPSITTSLVPCIRPSTLRYSPARLTPDLPPAEVWDATPDEKGLALSGDSGSGLECRPMLRNLAVSRAEDLRAELLRAEHLKASWEDNTEGSRRSLAERDGRPKLSLRRFFSSIGLNSVGRLVKGGRSSSMGQLSLPTPSRGGSASPSPTRRPPPTIQRTPSLQSLTTVLPLAHQLRKASSVQSLERRTERSTILGEVQIPYGLAPSPQVELHGALGAEDVLAPRVVRPVGRVTQAFPDGTLLLELTRPPNGPFGFIISRGKGRPDTGVYVEQVAEGAGEGLYVGLLGIGDEILQVNGEPVAGLTLDQVTHLMTWDSTASLRIKPSRRNQR